MGETSRQSISRLCLVLLLFGVSKVNCLTNIGIVQDKPLRINLAKVLNSDVRYPLLLKSETLTFIAERPQYSCLSKDEDDNRMDYLFNDNCEMRLAWSKKDVFLAEDESYASYENIKVIISPYDTEVSYTDKKGHQMKEIMARGCSLNAKKIDDGYAVNLTVKAATRKPKCSKIGISFENSVRHGEVPQPPPPSTTSGSSLGYNTDVGAVHIGFVKENQLTFIMAGVIVFLILQLVVVLFCRKRRHRHKFIVQSVTKSKKKSRAKARKAAKTKPKKKKAKPYGLTPNV